MTIEVELRSFISKEKFSELLDFFKNEAAFLGEDVQETFYFDAKEDVRIQRNNMFSKIWMKKGKMHDACREEIEIKCVRDDFNKLEEIFTSLGLPVNIKWFRTRHSFQWNDVIVTLDDTRGYGHIIELEQLSDEANKEITLALLKEKFATLNITFTPREEFDKKFQEYKLRWKELV